MTWVRIDDQWPDHPKTRALGRDGRALFIVGLCHCAQYELDGFIALDTLPLLLAKAEVPRTTVKRLTVVPTGYQHGAWEEADGGYLIHDYLIYNPSHAKLEAEREEGARRQRESRENRKHSGGVTVKSRRDTSVSNADASRDPVPVPSPSTQVSQSGTSAEPPAPDDDDPVETALAMLAERAMRRANGTVRNPKSYRDKCLASARTEHVGTLTGLHQRHPAWGPEHLANAIEEPAHISQPAPADPAEAARRQALATLGASDIDAQGIAEGFATDSEREAFWAARKAAK